MPVGSYNVQEEGTPITPLVGANMLLAFALELGLLVSVGYAVFHSGGPQWLRTVLAALVPLGVLLLWAEYAAPRSVHRLKMPWILLFKIVAFGFAAASLYYAGQPTWAAVYGVLAVAYLAVATATKSV
jgi:hypothetical protein